MTAAEITAIGAILVSLGSLLKIWSDSRRAEKKQNELLVDRRDTRASRMGDLMYERLHAELTRADQRIHEYERRHTEDQRIITELQRRNAELERGRIQRETLLADLGAQLKQVDNKVDTLQTGIFAKFERGELNGRKDEHA